MPYLEIRHKIVRSNRGEFAHQNKLLRSTKTNKKSNISKLDHYNSYSANRRTKKLTYSKLEEPKRQSLNAIIPAISYSAKSKSYNVGNNKLGVSGMAKRHAPDLFATNDDSSMKVPLGRHSVSVQLKSQEKGIDQKEDSKLKISHEQIASGVVSRKSNQ